MSMSLQHDRMAFEARRAMLSSIQGANAAWNVAARLTPQTTVWSGTVDWPRPDSGFQDTTTGSSLAVEFKPPGHGKSEYVRGLGQALTYLKDFEFAVLVVPRSSLDGFGIGQYLGSVLSLDFGQNWPIGLLEYDKEPSALNALSNLRARQGVIPALPQNQRSVFWAYWRDLSQHDLFFILKLMDRLGSRFTAAFRQFWIRYRARGRALTWEGTPRAANPVDSPFYRSELHNVDLSLRHIGVTDSEGRLTARGFDLLRCGNVYGPDSLFFRTQMGRHILLDGGYLDLLFWIDEVQRTIPNNDRRQAQLYYHALDTALEDQGVIDHAPVGQSKANFIRDELKVINKLGLFHMHGATQYFFPNEGLHIDWRAVVSMYGNGPDDDN
jgi:hypothetical protein